MTLVSRPMRGLDMRRCLMVWSVYYKLMSVPLTQTDLKERECSLCGAVTSHAIRARHHASGVDYALFECGACGGQWWDPFVNPGAEWYRHDDRYAGRNLDPIRKPNKKHVDVLWHLRGQKGTVLDIGCGVGNFLAYAERQGWQGWGIDFDPDAIDAGRKTFGLTRLEVASLEEFKQQHPELRFDLITFFDVFEHLDDHARFIALVRGMLNPGGHVALSTPYRHAWRWLIPADLPPRHLTRWDEASLSRFFTRHDFVMQSVRRLPATVYYIVLKLKFKYGAWSSVGLVQKARVAAERTPDRAGRYAGRVAALRVLAKVKDSILFGVPAVIIWTVLLVTRKRYTDLYVIAQSK